MIDAAKMVLEPQEAQKAQKAHAAQVDKFLEPEKVPANVVGMGYGVKWSNGEPTGKPALLALVTQKVDKEELRPGDLIPKKIGDMPTDVLAIGEPFAGQAEPLEVSIQLLARRARPASGGYSVGHKNITAGTIGTCVSPMVGAPGDPASGAPIEYSLAGMMGLALAVVFEPIGFNWQICIALVPGLAAREVAVSALGTVYALSAAGEDVAQSLAPVIAQTWSLATAYSLLALSHCKPTTAAAPEQSASNRKRVV